MEKLKCINAKPLKGNSIAPPLEEGKLYELSPDIDFNLPGVYTCGCGEEHFNVGIYTNMRIKETGVLDTENKHVNYVTCYKCREKLPFSFAEKATYPIWWAHSSRFEKVSA